MGLDHLDDLYRQVIMTHAAHPHHYGECEDPRVRTTRYNPSCGDVIYLSLVLSTDHKIKAIAFKGEGCAISKASASMMTDLVMNQPIVKVRQLIQSFSKMLMGEKSEVGDLKDAQLLAGVQQFPARIKCAKLPWQALEDALAEQGGS